MASIPSIGRAGHRPIDLVEPTAPRVIRCLPFGVLVAAALTLAVEVVRTAPPDAPTIQATFDAAPAT